MLSVTNGAKLTSSATILVVNNSGASGTLLVDGGSLLSATINLSGSSGTGGAKPFLFMNQTTGTSELVTTRITQSNNAATVQFNGGTLTVGTLGFGMQNVQWNGGTLSPGNASALGGGASYGSTAFGASNNQFFTEGVNHHIHIDVGDNTTSDRDFIQLGLNGISDAPVTLSGTMDVEYKGNNPVVGALYDVIITNGLITLNPSFNVVSHTAGIEFAAVFKDPSHTTLQLQITVPEPGMLALGSIGIVGLLHRRPRSRRLRSQDQPVA
jgi:hypothetical protein